MEREFEKIQELQLTDNRSLVLKSFSEKPYVWTYVYTKEDNEETYIGFYGNIKRKFVEYIKYNKDYVAFCFLNSYVGNAEFIKKIYDMNTKDCLGYNEYPEFEKNQSKTLKKVR